MRYLFGLRCVCALGAVSLVGCGDTAGACSGTVCPCTEEGILAAVVAGGGPYTFDCDGPTTVVTKAEIVIDRDVVLDGDGNLAVVGNGDHRVLSVVPGVAAELVGVTASGGFVQWDGQGLGILNEGTLTLRDCVIAENGSEFLLGGGAGISNAGEMTIIDSTVTRNFAGHGMGGGIYNDHSATLVLANSTVSDNGADGDGGGLYGGGIFNSGEMAIINSTVSGNRAYDVVFGLGLGGGIANAGSMSVTNSTVWGNSADSGGAIAMEPRFFPDGYTEIANTLIDGDCEGTGDGSNLKWVSRGNNIESTGDTCRFDQPTDQANVAGGQLVLGPLQDNGGPTMTHALGAGSVAIDHIPAIDCQVTEDQRGLPRPGGMLCDVGAFEVQP